MSDFATAYAAAVESISREDGLTEIQEKLAEKGVESTVEQTGGMCMVLFVYRADGSIVAVSRDGDLLVGWYKDQESFDDGEDARYAYFESVTDVVDAVLA